MTNKDQGVFLADEGALAYFAEALRRVHLLSLFGLVSVSLVLTIFNFTFSVLVIWLSALGIWGSRVMARRGHLQQSTFMTLVILTLLSDYLMFTGNGLQNTALLVYPITIVIGGLLLSKRAFSWLLVLMFSLLAVIAWGESAGLVATTKDSSAEVLFNYGVAVVTMSGMGTLVYWISRYARKSHRASLESHNQIAEQEERYRLISQVSSDYIFSTEVDADGRPIMQWVSESFEGITGYTFDELKAIGGWEAILHPADREQDARDMALLHENSQVITQARIIHKNGETRWVQVYAHPVWDEKEDRLTGIYGAVQNITERKAAEDKLLQALEREKTYSNQLAALNEVGRAVSRLRDLPQLLEIVYQQARSSLPLDFFFIALYDEETNTISFPIMYDEGRPWVQPDSQLSDDTLSGRTIRTGEPFLMNYWPEELVEPKNLGGDADKLTTSLMFAPLSLGEKIIGVISVQSYTRYAYDENALTLLSGIANQVAIAIENARLFEAEQHELHERTRAEAQVRRLNMELEQRVIARTNDLRRANEELESISYTMAHDLRAPARAVIGFATLLKEHAGGHLDEEGVRFLGRIMKSASQMGKMIDELLNYFHLGRTPLNRQNLDIQSVVRAVIHAYQKEVSARQINLRVAELPPCQADPVLIRLVFAHLIENSIKFTSTREKPEIEVGAEQREGLTTYYVKDNGIGFDMQYAGKLFGVFQRLHREEEFEGVGVGLAIVRRIVTRHSGRVWVEAGYEEGACFYFTIPDDPGVLS